MSAPPAPPPDAIRCISGLVYQVTRPGHGREKPGPDDVVRVSYEAVTEAGDPFARTGEGGRTMSVGEAGPGLAEALQLMSVGQRSRAWIPPSLASDEARAAGVGTLVYDLELLGFERTKEYPAVPVELTSPRLDDGA